MAHHPQHRRRRGAAAHLPVPGPRRRARLISVLARRRRRRKARRTLSRRLVGLLLRPRGFLLALLCLGAGLLASLNLAVAFFGETFVFPLSPRHLGAKSEALRSYAEHRSRCLFSGHETLAANIERAAARHRLDKHLLGALVEVESASRPHRISPAGAMGPAQLMPATARHLKVQDPFDPEEGIDGGARYLAAMLRRFEGNEKLALAAYNAGPGNVREGRIPRNGETEHYVERVMRSTARRRAEAGR